MVADYSSYLGFVGAVYFTMSLNEFLTIRIWNPQDAHKLAQSLDGLGMKNDVNFKQAVLDANKRKGLLLQKELFKKSIIGLFVVAFLLLFCGSESSLSRETPSALPLLQLELAYTCVYFFISLIVLWRLIFSKWKCVVFYIVSIIGVFALIRWKKLVFNSYDIEQFFINNIGMIVCITVTLPILWQIFITWLHKSVFYGYVKSKIRNAQEEYEKVVEYVDSKQFDKLPKRYHEIYMHSSQSTLTTSPQQALDDSLLEYRGVLYNDIRVIGLNVRLHQLLFSWILFKLRLFAKWIKVLFQSKGRSVSTPNRLIVKNYEDYAIQYKKLKKTDKGLKLKDFCNNERISFNEFNTYYCKYCQKNDKHDEADICY